MRLIRLDPYRVQLGKTYAHTSGRKFMAFHFASNGAEMEVELLEYVGDSQLPEKRFMTVVDFEGRLRSGAVKKID